MEFNDIFKNPFIDAKMTFNFELKLDVPFIGKTDVLYLDLSGFRDEDGDFMPEFDVTLHFLGNAIVENETIEIAPTLLMSALGNGMTGVTDLFESVFAGVKGKGISLPWEK